MPLIKTLSYSPGHPEGAAKNCPEVPKRPSHRRGHPTCLLCLVRSHSAAWTAPLEYLVRCILAWPHYLRWHEEMGFYFFR
ncbi:hypothetical protein J3E68DRAFT_392460 [Trichoderma sp. SZMC 28012]